MKHWFCMFLDIPAKRTLVRPSNVKDFYLPIKPLQTNQFDKEIADFFFQNKHHWKWQKISTLINTLRPGYSAPSKKTIEGPLLSQAI